jgi:hypothetical protein
MSTLHRRRHICSPYTDSRFLSREVVPEIKSRTAPRKHEQDTVDTVTKVPGLPIGLGFFIFWSYWFLRPGLLGVRLVETVPKRSIRSPIGRCVVAGHNQTTTVFDLCIYFWNLKL